MTMEMTAKTGGCGGDGCDVRDPWPLHHVRHRGIFCRLCSSCVLKYHPGSFCTLCFVLIDAGSPATNPLPPPAEAAAVVHCTKCPSVSHLACLPRPDLGSQFVCPSCKSPEGFSYFPKENRDRDGRKRMVDVESANVLLAAARLAANSMSKAAAQVRSEAERKVSEAAKARKRAREMLEKALVICKKETERNERKAAAAAAAVTLKAAPMPTQTTPKPRQPPPVAAVAAMATEEPKRKYGKVGPAAAVAAVATDEPKRKYGKVGLGSGEQKRVQSREIEKWMRFHEPILMPAGQGKREKDKLKVGVPVEAMSRVPNSLGQEYKEKKGNVSSSPSGRGVEEEERSLVGSGEKGPRLPQATQGALVSRTNPRSIFTGSPNTASLHS